MTCRGCGKEMTGNVYHCRSNQPDGPNPPSCRNKACEGLRFCSSDCLQKCWREVNWPKVTYNIEPFVDEAEAVNESRKLIEIRKLDQLWGGAAE